MSALWLCWSAATKGADEPQNELPMPLPELMRLVSLINAVKQLLDEPIGHQMLTTLADIDRRAAERAWLTHPHLLTRNNTFLLFSPCRVLRPKTPGPSGEPGSFSHGSGAGMV